jgi:uncharacterized protein
MTATIRRLADGRRLHLNHGPIDVVLEAWGVRDEVERAYAQAAAAFPFVLPTLCRELPRLRSQVDDMPFEGPVAERMRRACLPLITPPVPRSGIGGEAAEGGGEVRCVARETLMTSPSRAARLPPLLSRFARQEGRTFLTPMAAVAGAVADHLLAAMTSGRRLEKAYVNDGGDIAFHLAAGKSLNCGLVADLAAPALDGRFELTHDLPVRGLATSGRATKGQGGRSFSLGIADAVTVLAHDAASADAAATIVANAVDLPGHPAVARVPADSLDPDNDLGARPITIGVGALSHVEIDAALARGRETAELLTRAGRIHAAVLVLRGRMASVGLTPQRLAA